MKNAEDLTELINRRIESRYRRIAFVHGELAKVADAAKGKSKEADTSGVYKGSFQDLVFSTIDFSVYQKINAEEFTLLFDEGLYDFEQSFYQKAFKTSREKIRQTISRSYLKVGPFYVCRKTNPLILSIMRSIHTSLEFAPLCTPDEISDVVQFPSLVAALDGVVVRHYDGTETRLFVRSGVLYATFHPLGKAYTVTLIKQ
jgi:hypothetical protein